MSAQNKRIQYSFFLDYKTITFTYKWVIKSLWAQLLYFLNMWTTIPLLQNINSSKTFHSVCYCGRVLQWINMKILSFTRRLLEIGGAIPFSSRSFFVVIIILCSAFHPFYKFMMFHIDDLVLVSQTIFMMMILLATINELINFYVYRNEFEDLFCFVECIIEKCKKNKKMCFNFLGNNVLIRFENS